MKSYIEITFTSIKFFWFCVLMILIGAVVMRYVMEDSLTALIMLLLAIFMSLVMMIGSYFYMKKYNL
jgi:uncharacterized membrane protein